MCRDHNASKFCVSIVFFQTDLSTLLMTWHIGQHEVDTSSTKLQTDSQHPEKATSHIGWSQLLYIQWPFCLHHNLMWGGFHWWVVVWARTIAYPYPTGSYWQNSQRSDLHPCKGSCPPVIWKKGEMNEQKRMIERLKKYTIPVARVFLVSRFDFQSLCVGKEFMCWVPMILCVI